MIGIVPHTKRRRPSFYSHLRPVFLRGYGEAYIFLTDEGLSPEYIIWSEYGYSWTRYA